MLDTRTVKKIFKWNLLTKRSQGRPKYRWEDDIKQDIWEMKVKNWKPASRIERNGKMLRRPKLSTTKGSSVPEEEEEVSIITQIISMVEDVRI